MKRKRFIDILVFIFVGKHLHFSVTLNINGAKVLVFGNC